MEPEITITSAEIYIGYEFSNDSGNCKICRGSLLAPPLQELNNESKTKIEMTVSLGKCGHLFHKKCIHELKKNNYLSCPSCNVVWSEEDQLPCEIGIEQ
jgi:hypothetical protein